MKQLTLFFLITISVFTQTFAQELKIKTGFWGGIKYLSNNEKISKNEFDEILKTRTSDFQKFYNYRDNYKTFNFLTYLGSSLTGIGLGMYIIKAKQYGTQNYNNSKLVTGLGLVSWIGLAITEHSYKKKMKSFLYKSNPSSSFDIRLAPTAVGFSYNFNEKKTN